MRLARDDYVTSVTGTSITGSDTYNLATSDGNSFAVGSTLYAQNWDDDQNNGRKTVASTTSTSVTVEEALVNETPSQTAIVSSLNQINSSNRVEVKEFSRQGWDGSTNQVRIEFSDRAGRD